MYNCKNPFPLFFSSPHPRRRQKRLLSKIAFRCYCRCRPRPPAENGCREKFVFVVVGNPAPSRLSKLAALKNLFSLLSPSSRPRCRRKWLPSKIGFCCRCRVQHRAAVKIGCRQKSIFAVVGKSAPALRCRPAARLSELVSERSRTMRRWWKSRPLGQMVGTACPPKLSAPLPKSPAVKNWFSPLSASLSPTTSKRKSGEAAKKKEGGILRLRRRKKKERGNKNRNRVGRLGAGGG